MVSGDSSFLFIGRKVDMAIQVTTGSSIDVYFLCILPSSAMEALKDKNRKACEL
jgi:hypothetical protein